MPDDIIHIPVQWTNAEKRIIEVLMDGHRHKIEEFHDPEPKLPNGEREEAFYSRANVTNQMTRMRAKLKGTGYGVVVEYHRLGYYWRLVRLIGEGGES